LERPAGRTVIAFVVGAVVGAGLGVHYTGMLRGGRAYGPPEGPSAEELAEGKIIAGRLAAAEAAYRKGDHHEVMKLCFGLLSRLGDGAVIRPRVVALGARAKFAMREGAEVVDFVEESLRRDPRRAAVAERPIGRRGAWPGTTHELLVMLGDAYLDAAAAAPEDADENEGPNKRELTESAAYTYRLVPRVPFREIYAVSPRYAEARLRLGRAYMALGKDERARIALDEIVRDFPAAAEKDEAVRLLGRIEARMESREGGDR